MIKWLWYGNAALVGAAVLVLSLGLWGLGGLDGADGLGAGGDGSGAGGGDMGSEGDGQNDSPLVATVRHYAQRWVPKPPKGSVRATLVPAEVEGEVHWRLDGGEWQSSEALIEGVLAGSHKVEFEEAQGWLPPAVMTVQVSKDQTSEVRGVYRVPPPPPGKGGLRVTLGPAEAVEEGAQWRIDGGEWQSSEATLEEVVEGSHRLEYKGVEGWMTPAVGTVQVAKDETLEVSKIYELPPPPPPMGGVQVVLGPEAVRTGGAQWRLDSGPWQESGAELGEVLTGGHQVQFKPVAGWVTPDPCSVEVGENEISVLERRYAKSPPPAPKIALVQTLWVVGKQSGLAWFRVPGQQNNVALYRGETIGSYRLASIGDGRVTLTRDGYDFELKVVEKKPQPAPPKVKKPASPPPIVRPGKAPGSPARPGRSVPPARPSTR